MSFVQLPAARTIFSPHFAYNAHVQHQETVTHDVGVSLHSKTHPLFMKYSNGTSTVLCISLSELVSCAFSTIPICPFLILGIFHLLVLMYGWD